MALDPITAVADLVNNAINKIWPDATEKEKGKLTLLTQEMGQGFQLLLKQAEINLEEAKSARWWVAGWRPYAGWVAGTGFAWQYVVGPFFYWISCLVGHPTPIVQLDSGELMTLLLGMLGLGAYRSYDKKQVNGGSK